MGNGNTGGKSIVMHSDGALYVSTHNVGRDLTITTDGKIGVGIDAPTAQLHSTAAYNVTGAIIGGGASGYNNTLELQNAGGTRLMTVKGDGKVQIGDANTTTSGTLNVKGNAVLDDGTNARLTLQADGTSLNHILSTTTNFGSYCNISYQAADHIFKYGGTERFRIKTNGQLWLYSNAGDNQLNSKRTGLAGSSGDYFFHLSAINKDDVTVGNFGFHRDTAADDSRIVFNTRNTGGSLQERLRITSYGHLLVSNNTYYLPHAGNFAADYVKARYFTTINHASGQNWGGGNGSAVSTLSPASDTNTGGNFVTSGASENNLGYVDGWGLIPFGGTWRAQNNDAASNFDGGWQKYVTNLPGDDWTYMSTILVRRVGSTTSGQFYHGCDGGNTLNQDGTTNNNPYFQYFGIATLPQDIWCLSIGFITGNAGGDNGDAGSSTAVGVWRLDTGQKLYNGDWYRMKNGSTTQTHRTYLYYSTNSSAQLQWRESGFYTCDGSEPSISQLSHGRLCFKAGTGIVPVEDA
tara:strand:- start:6 stop:1565 length:1560 start_codon:yes stop_codon:yes gene_type:complete